ncbi:MAG: FAD-dependent thymidylate synthase [Bacillota bacterium]|nr:FAD-dependent thymidylate synthase [Bacillota bacterium]
MQVDILVMAPDFLRIIWCAARTCYSARTPQELWSKPPEREEMLRLARKILSSGHWSVVEHCTVTFAVAGVSRALLAQYSRHRIGVSLSVQSQRFVSERSDYNQGLFDAVVPPSVAGRPEALALYREELQRAQKAYDALTSLGIPKEDARFVLPNAAATNFVTTLNLRSLLDIYHKRVATPGAQWEIRRLVRRMAELVLEREPWLAEFFPPAAPEGTEAVQE